MKKKIAVLSMMILFILMMSTCVSAASALPSLTSEKSTLNPGDEVVINIKTTSLDGLSNVRGYTATLTYDKDVFEEVTENSVKGTTNIVQFNPATGQMVASCTSDVSETITLKVKSQVRSTNATVTISKFIAIDDNEVQSDPKSASITFKVVGNIADEQPANNNNNVNNNAVSNTGNNAGSKVSNVNATKADNTLSSTKLPKTGVAGYAAFAIAAVTVIAVVSIVRYKNIMK